MCRPNKKFFFFKKDQIRLVGAEFDTYDLEVLDSQTHMAVLWSRLPAAAMISSYFIII